MYSYRFLAGITLAVLLVGVVSIVDQARAGAQPARTLAEGDALAAARIVGVATTNVGADSVSGQQFQGGFQGLNFQGGFQGGGFNLQGGGQNFQGGFQGGINLQGGFQGGFQGGCTATGFNQQGFNQQGFNQQGFNQQGGLNLQGGFQGGFQGGCPGGINSPLGASGRLIAVTGHFNCTYPGEVIGLEIVLSQTSTGAVAMAETQVPCAGPQPPWNAVATTVSPASFQPGTAQACALAVGPITRTQWCRQGGTILLPGGPVVLPPPPPPPIVVPLVPPLVLPPPAPVFGVPEPGEVVLPVAAPTP